MLRSISLPILIFISLVSSRVFSQTRIETALASYVVENFDEMQGPWETDAKSEFGVQVLLNSNEQTRATLQCFAMESSGEILGEVHFNIHPANLQWRVDGNELIVADDQKVRKYTLPRLELHKEYSYREAVASPYAKNSHSTTNGSLFRSYDGWLDGYSPGVNQAFYTWDKSATKITATHTAPGFGSDGTTWRVEQSVYFNDELGEAFDKNPGELLECHRLRLGNLGSKASFPSWETLERELRILYFRSSGRSYTGLDVGSRKGIRFSLEIKDRERYAQILPQFLRQQPSFELPYPENWAYHFTDGTARRSDIKVSTFPELDEQGRVIFEKTSAHANEKLPLEDLLHPSTTRSELAHYLSLAVPEFTRLVGRPPKDIPFPILVKVQANTEQGISVLAHYVWTQIDFDDLKLQSSIAKWPNFRSQKLLAQEMALRTQFERETARSESERKLRAKQAEEEARKQFEIQDSIQQGRALRAFLALTSALFFIGIGLAVLSLARRKPKFAAVFFLTLAPQGYAQTPSFQFDQGADALKLIFVEFPEHFSVTASDRSTFGLLRETQNQNSGVYVIDWINGERVGPGLSADEWSSRTAVLGQNYAACILGTQIRLLDLRTGRIVARREVGKFIFKFEFGGDHILRADDLWFSLPSLTPITNSFLDELSKFQIGESSSEGQIFPTGEIYSCGFLLNNELDRPIGFVGRFSTECKSDGSVRLGFPSSQGGQSFQVEKRIAQQRTIITGEFSNSIALRNSPEFFVKGGWAAKNNSKPSGLIIGLWKEVKYANPQEDGLNVAALPECVLPANTIRFPIVCSSDKRVLKITCDSLNLQFDSETQMAEIQLRELDFRMILAQLTRQVGARKPHTWERFKEYYREYNLLAIRYFESKKLIPPDTLPLFLDVSFEFTFEDHVRLVSKQIMIPIVETNELADFYPWKIAAPSGSKLPDAKTFVWALPVPAYTNLKLPEATVEKYRFSPQPDTTTVAPAVPVVSWQHRLFSFLYPQSKLFAFTIFAFPICVHVGIRINRHFAKDYPQATIIQTLWISLLFYLMAPFLGVIGSVPIGFLLHQTPPWLWFALVDIALEESIMFVPYWLILLVAIHSTFPTAKLRDSLIAALRVNGIWTILMVLVRVFLVALTDFFTRV